MDESVKALENSEPGKLQPASAGIISRGLGGAHAVAYWLGPVLGILAGDFHRDFHDQIDQVEFAEYAEQNMLGMWAGERTPYFVTGTPDLQEVLQRGYRRFVCGEQG